MRTLWWLVSLAYMGVIFYLSAHSGAQVGIPAPWDKLAHLCEYAVLGFLLSKATGRWALGWVLAAWWGTSDEVHQAFVPGREAGINDWWADLTGSFVGSYLIAPLRPLWFRRGGANKARGHD